LYVVTVREYVVVDPWQLYTLRDAAEAASDRLL